MITPETIEENLPKVVRWVTEMEKAILQDGQPLSPQNRKDAVEIGVHRVDEVRVIVLDSMPRPGDVRVKQLAEEAGLIIDQSAGMTFGHAIALKSGSYDRKIIAHELVHVRQYERLGGIEPFLKEYVKEVVFPPGYPNGPLEQEAILLTAYITRTDR
jgi:hypothetical protein